MKTYCRMCGIELTNPESIKKGIGPECEVNAYKGSSDQLLDKVQDTLRSVAVASGVRMKPANCRLDRERGEMVITLEAGDREIVLNLLNDRLKRRHVACSVDENGVLLNADGSRVVAIPEPVKVVKPRKTKKNTLAKWAMNRAWDIRRAAAEKYDCACADVSMGACLSQAWIEVKFAANHNVFEARQILKQSASQDVHDLLYKYNWIAARRGQYAGHRPTGRGERAEADASFAELELQILFRAAQVAA